MKETALVKRLLATCNCSLAMNSYVYALSTAAENTDKKIPISSHPLCHACMHLVSVIISFSLNRLSSLPMADDSDRTSFRSMRSPLASLILTLMHTRSVAHSKIIVTQDALVQALVCHSP